jgi:hypothetical protein
VSGLPRSRRRSFLSLHDCKRAKGPSSQAADIQNGKHFVRAGFMMAKSCAKKAYKWQQQQKCDKWE